MPNSDKAGQLHAALQEERNKNRALRQERDGFKTEMAELRTTVEGMRSALRKGDSEYEEVADELEVEALKGEVHKLEEKLTKLEGESKSALRMSFFDLKARIKYGDADYEEKLAAAQEHWAANPNAFGAIAAAEDPGEAAYELGEKILAKKGATVKTKTKIDPIRDALGAEDDLSDDEPPEDDEGDEAPPREKDVEARLKAQKKVPPDAPSGSGDRKTGLSALSGMGSLAYRKLPKEVRARLRQQAAKSGE